MTKKKSLILLPEPNLSPEEYAEDLPFAVDIKEDLRIFFNEKIDTANSSERNTFSEVFLDLFPNICAPLFLTDTASSSLDVAHYLVKKNQFPPFSSLLCRNQTKGRGQLRRHWISPEGNIYAALSLPNIYPFNTEAAAPALGAVLVHALNQMGYETFLKWPNDIIQKKNGVFHKVSGILLEERNNVLIAGIGINILQAPQKNALRSDYFMEAGILEKTSSLDETFNFSHEIQNIFLRNIPNISEKTIDKLKNFPNYISMIDSNFLAIIPLWLALVENIFLCYKFNLLNESKKQNAFLWQELAQKYLAFIGEDVKIHHPIVHTDQKSSFKEGISINGRLCGITDNGELLLQTEYGLLTILGGSLSR